jgi:predicted RND superfamily exporter protein
VPEALLKKAAAFVLARYRLISFIFALLTAASLYTVWHMEIRTDIIDVLPSGNSAVSQFRDFMRQYNVLETVTVIVTSRTNSVEERADLIEGLAEGLGKSPLVERVDHTAFGKGNEFFLRNFPLFLDKEGLRQLSVRLAPSGVREQVRRDYQRMLSPVTGPAEFELIEKDPLNLREIVAAAMKRGRPDNPFDLSMGYYITKDHSTALIFVRPAGRSRDMAFVERLTPELEAIAGEVLAENGNPQGISVAFTGGHIFSEETRRVIRGDVISSTLLSTLLIALLIWIAYRVRPVILMGVGFTLLASLSMTLAAAYLIFGSLNIVTSIVCALLIGMYVDYSIVTLKRFGDEMLLGKGVGTALEITVTKAGASTFMSALTTSVSFFSIIATSFDGLYELGIVSGLGVLICYFVNLFLLNSLLAWAGSRGAGRILSVREPRSGMDRLAGFAERRPRRIVYTGIALVVIVMAGARWIGFDNNPEHIGIKDSRAVAAMKALGKKLGVYGEPLQIMIRQDDAAKLTAAFDRSEQLLARWKQEGLISRSDSLGSLLPPPRRQLESVAELGRLLPARPVSADALENMLAGEFDRFGMTYNPERLKGYLRVIAEAVNRSGTVGLVDIQGLAASRVGRFYNRDDMSVAAYLYSESGWDSERVEALRREVAAEGPGWVLTGSPILYAEIKDSILWGSLFAALITFAMNALFLILFLKKDRGYFFLALLPVSLGFALTVAVMGWLGAPFNFINIGVMALIFGFGVDYGIYMMQAYLQEETRSVGNALRLAGKNVLMCAATTIAGCGSLVTAEFAGIASLGLVLTIGALCCAAITLLLLPALLALKERRERAE